MFDETQEKIMNAAMELIMEKGYGSATTREIAVRAGVNECTLFRKFAGKKDIVLSAMTMPAWNPQLKESDFRWTGDLTEDLTNFSRVYMQKVTPRMVQVSIGLRSPELFEETAPGILQIPQTCRNVLREYFAEMGEKGELISQDYEGMAVQFLAMNFGFVFFKASFGDRLTATEQEDYIRGSVERFVDGIG